MPAVCSFGMPESYNRHIHRIQKIALRPELEVKPGTRVLDAGCGVGRWTSLLASRGAEVTAVDISSEMLEIARDGLESDGLPQRVTLKRASLCELEETPGSYDLVVCVTVLQHVTDRRDWEESLTRLIGCAKDGGRIVLLEVAPTADSLVRVGPRTHFAPRTRGEFVDFCGKNGAVLIRERGVDVLPFKYRLLGTDVNHRAQRALLNVVVLASDVLDPIIASTQWGTRRCWHRLMVFERRDPSALQREG